MHAPANVKLHWRVSLFRRGLTTLNASSISPAERWDAEVNYLRLVTDELAAAGEAAQAAGGDAAATREAVLAAHPRFGELTQVQASVFVQWVQHCVQFCCC